MASEVFLDTNVLVYAFDLDVRAKHERALAVLKALSSRRTFISVQVLSEFANVMTHPRKLAWDPDHAAAIVSDLTLEHIVVQVTHETVGHALRARCVWGLSYYDAQIWSSAAMAGVPVLLSEDFPDGRELGPVRFVNPFADEFDMAMLG